MKIVREHIYESLKDEIISKLMRVYNKFDDQYKKYLQSLSEEDLDEMLGNYYLYDSTKPKK